LEPETRGLGALLDGELEELAPSTKRRRRKTLGPSFFNLSGGVLRREPRTSQRIDALLARILEDAEPDESAPHIDKNLEYLHTSLQLDMISLAAEEPEETLPLEEPEDRDEPISF
jgi:hypothetical protein